MANALRVPTMQEYAAEGKMPEILFWVGCSCSFDDRAKKITKAFAKLLNKAGVDFAVLGSEESCTGDPAKRAGNEFLFQMQAKMNIEVLNGYGIKKIVTACPHCYNTIQNEYPELGGEYEVVHHTQLLQFLLEEGRLKVEGGKFKGKKITYHDPCYLGRANGEFEASRDLLRKLEVELIEMKDNRKNSLCCGAGGAQMFKESEKGDWEINEMRIAQAQHTGAGTIVTGCPFCNTMLADGMTKQKTGENLAIKDVVEMIAEAEDL